MSFWSRNNGDGQGGGSNQPNQDPNAQTQGQGDPNAVATPSQDPAQGGQPPAAVLGQPPASQAPVAGDDPQERDLSGATEEELNALYDESGISVYALPDGTPCDPEGNVIPETRPQASGSTPATQTPPVVSAPPAVTQPRNFVSPLQPSVLTDVEREAALQHVTPQVLALIETMTDRKAERVIAARDQQRVAARELGIPPELIDEYAPRMSQMQHAIPPELRGTKQGASLALLMAAWQEGEETGNLAGVLGKLSGMQAATASSSAASPTPSTAPGRKPQAPLPPSAVTHTPNAAPDSVRQYNRRNSSGVPGLSSAQLAAIREERNGF